MLCQNVIAVFSVFSFIKFCISFVQCLYSAFVRDCNHVVMLLCRVVCHLRKRGLSIMIFHNLSKEELVDVEQKRPEHRALRNPRGIFVGTKFR